MLSNIVRKLTTAALAFTAISNAQVLIFDPPTLAITPAQHAGAKIKISLADVTKSVRAEFQATHLDIDVCTLELTPLIPSVTITVFPTADFMFTLQDTITFKINPSTAAAGVDDATCSTVAYQVTGTRDTNIVKCQLTGDPHIHKFDGTDDNETGLQNMVLVDSPDFMLSTENHNCWEGHPSCSYSAVMQYLGLTIRMTRVVFGALQGSVSFKTTGYGDEFLRVFRDDAAVPIAFVNEVSSLDVTGNQIIKFEFNTDIIVTVMIDDFNGLSISTILPQRYSEFATGLCSNNNAVVCNGINCPIPVDKDISGCFRDKGVCPTTHIPVEGLTCKSSSTSCVPPPPTPPPPAPSSSSAPAVASSSMSLSSTAEVYSTPAPPAPSSSSSQVVSSTVTPPPASSTSAPCDSSSSMTASSTASPAASSTSTTYSSSSMVVSSTVTPPPASSTTDSSSSAAASSSASPTGASSTSTPCDSSSSMAASSTSATVLPTNTATYTSTSTTTSSSATVSPASSSQSVSATDAPASSTTSNSATDSPASTSQSVSATNAPASSTTTTEPVTEIPCESTATQDAASSSQAPMPTVTSSVSPAETLVDCTDVETATSTAPVPTAVPSYGSTGVSSNGSGNAPSSAPSSSASAASSGSSSPSAAGSSATSSTGNSHSIGGFSSGIASGGVGSTSTTSSGAGHLVAASGFSVALIMLVLA